MFGVYKTVIQRLLILNVLAFLAITAGAQPKFTAKANFGGLSCFRECGVQCCGSPTNCCLGNQGGAQCACYATCIDHC